MLDHSWKFTTALLLLASGAVPSWLQAQPHSPWQLSAGVGLMLGFNRYQGTLGPSLLVAGAHRLGVRVQARAVLEAAVSSAIATGGDDVTITAPCGSCVANGPVEPRSTLATSLDVLLFARPAERGAYTLASFGVTRYSARQTDAPRARSHLQLGIGHTFGLSSSSVLFASLRVTRVLNASPFPGWRIPFVFGWRGRI